MKLVNIILVYNITIMDSLIKNGYLPPEIEEGNIEYKLKISTKSDIRTGSLESQMNWRINQSRINNGIPEAIYFIGIDDDGTLGNQTIKEIKESVNEIKKIINNIEAKVKNIIIKKIKDSFVAMVIINKFIVNTEKNEINYIFLGNSEVGKTTIVANLCYDIKDNNGIARKSVLRHTHEKEEGYTSSIANEIMGIETLEDNSKKLLNYSSFSNNEWENISKKSDTIINIIDTPGTDKYYKTSFFALTSYYPNNYMIVFSPQDNFNNVKNYYLPYLEYIFHNGGNIIVIFNKINSFDKDIYNKFKFKVKNFLQKYEPYNEFDIDCNNSFNIDKLKDYILNNVKINKIENTSKKNFIITNTIKNNDIGTIFTGYMKEGFLKINDDIFIGPLKNDSSIVSTKVISIHKKLVPSMKINQYESGSIIIDLPIKYMNQIDKNCQLFCDYYCDLLVDNIVVEVVSTNIDIKSISDNHFMMFIENNVESVIVNNITNTSIKIEFIKKNIQKLIKKSSFGILKNLDNYIIFKN